MSAPGGTAKLAGVRKIGVLRPNAVGDFVFALPALHALKRAYPEAELVLLGRPWQAAFLAGRPGPVDRVVAVPPLPGVGLAPGAPIGAAALEFVHAMQGEAFDIACQMYGGGRYSNPLVASFGARLTVGARADGAPALDRWVRHVEPANRRLALLEVAALAGAPEVRLEQELAVTQADRDEAARVVPERATRVRLPKRSAPAAAGRAGERAPAGDDGAEPGALAALAARAERAGQAERAETAETAEEAPTVEPGEQARTADIAETAVRVPTNPAVPQAAHGREGRPEAPVGRVPPLVLLQPGSTDPRRCWPAASFAAVGDALARIGAQVAVNGTAAEAPLVRRVIGSMQAPAIDLSGKLGLGGLCGLIERAACVVSNDTGPLHLALAIGTPAVGIFWLTNLIDGTPLRPGLLRAALSLRQDCPVCGVPNLSSRCPHDASFVADVPVEQVVSLAADLLRDRQAAW